MKVLISRLVCLTEDRLFPQLGGHFAGALEQALRRDDLVDQADAVGLGRVEQAPGQEQVTSRSC